MSIDRSNFKKPIRIMVIDLDRCALSFMDDREDFLSQKLIDIARDESKSYAGFYVCTHRCFATIGNRNDKYFLEYHNNNFYATQYQVIQRNNANQSKKFDPSNQLTRRLSENFQKTTQLQCLAVSMLDDVGLSETVTKEPCGFSYENVLKKFEGELIEKNSGDLSIDGDYVIAEFTPSYPTLSYDDFQAFSGNKNRQLIQIAKHAAAQFPDSLIELDFFDDVLHLCEEIKNISSAEIPNVKIKSFRHSTGGTIVEADLDKPIASINGAGWSNIEKLGFFNQNKKPEDALVSNENFETAPALQRATCYKNSPIFSWS